MGDEERTLEFRREITPPPNSGRLEGCPQPISEFRQEITPPPNSGLWEGCPPQRSEHRWELAPPPNIQQPTGRIPPRVAMMFQTSTRLAAASAMQRQSTNETSSIVVLPVMPQVNTLPLSSFVPTQAPSVATEVMESGMTDATTAEAEETASTKQPPQKRMRGRINTVNIQRDFPHDRLAVEGLRCGFCDKVLETDSRHAYVTASRHVARRSHRDAVARVGGLSRESLHAVLARASSAKLNNRHFIQNKPHYNFTNFIFLFYLHLT